MTFVSERFKEMTAEHANSVPFTTTDLYRALGERALNSSLEEMEHEYDDIPADPVLAVIKPGKAWIINRMPRGFEVLVTPRVYCIDRDFATASEAELEMLQSISDEEMLQLVHAQLVESELNLQLRVYRTAAGLRMLVESQTLRPDGEVHLLVQRHLQGDAIYAAVCARSKAFAMRLTGKPARVAKLEGEPYAVCRYIGTVGSAGASADLAAIIATHDERTRALEENLPLA